MGLMRGRTVILICWFFLIMTNLLMMKKMRSDGLCMSWKLILESRLILVSRKSWENRPFKTPFYVNVVNEGILL